MEYAKLDAMQFGLHVALGQEESLEFPLEVLECRQPFWLAILRREFVWQPVLQLDVHQHCNQKKSDSGSFMSMWQLKVKV